MSRNICKQIAYRISSLEDKKKMKIALRSLLTAILLFPAIGTAQTMVPTKQLEVGDRATFNYKNRSKAETMTQEVVGVSGTEIRMTETRGSKTVELIYDSSQSGFKQYICWPLPELCKFSPPNKHAVFPIEKGKKWKVKNHVIGETFEADLEKKYKVRRLEKVKVPAGEFEAFKITFSGKVNGKNNKGQSFRFTEKATYWYALINGKQLMIKLKYSNKNGDRVTKELTSVNYR
jgi:hypothetical protein